MSCLLCNSNNVIDNNCYSCYLYYDKHNENVIDDFENNRLKLKDKIITPCLNCDDDNIKLLENQYICLTCGCSNGYKFDNYVKVVGYKKMNYNRKYHLEKYIKKYEHYKDFDRIKVIVLFNQIINELLSLKLKRKRVFKFDLILKKVFNILDYKITIDVKENVSFNNLKIKI